MTFESNPPHPNDGQSAGKHDLPDSFPYWVFEPDQGREEEEAVIAFRPRRSQASRQNVVELFPVPPKPVDSLLPEADYGEEPLPEEDDDLPYLPQGPDNPLDEGDFCPMPEKGKRKGAVENVKRKRNKEQLDKARARQATYFQERRRQKKKKAFANRFRKICRVLCALLLVTSFVLAFRLPLGTLPESGVRLSGNVLVTPAQVNPLLRDLEGKPVVSVNPQEVAHRIQDASPLVDKVYVRRRLFPARLDVTVVEKPIWGVLQVKPSVSENHHRLRSPQQWGVMHWDNSITPLSARHLPPHWQARLGHSLTLISASLDISPRKLERYRKLAQYLDSYPRLARFKSLDVSVPTDIIAHFDGFDVRLGRADESLMPRTQRLFHLSDVIHEYQSELAYVDLRWHQQILFKKKGKLSASVSPKETPDRH